MKKIAIIGATGMLGKPVTREFINAGFEVTLLVRDTAKATAAFSTDVRIVKGDVRDVNSLVQFLQGQDALYINLSVNPSSTNTDFQPEREGMDNIIEAARRSGIKRIGYLASLVQFYAEANWWVFDIKHQCINKIKQPGIAYSIFYPSTFMESFDKGAYRQGNAIVLSGHSKYKLYLIAGADYGKQVVKAFEMNNGNHEYVVQGQQAFTPDEAAQLVIDNYKREEIKITRFPFGVFKFLGLFSQKLNYGANIVNALNNYPEKFDAQKTWDELGKPSTLFIDYIKSASNTAT